MRGMPEGWVEVELGEVFRGKRRSSVVPAKEPDRRFELYSVPSFETGVPERLYGSEIGSSKQEVAPGSVLLCRINPRINRVWVVGEAGSDPQIASTEWISLPRFVGMTPRFAMHALQTPKVRRHLTSSVSGVGGSLMRVRMDALWRTRIPLAPLREQRRIVAKIESLFARLDEGIAALKRAEANLERYRASVLKAAVEGRLSEQWRRENPPEETGEELLQRILAVRRKRWEEEQLARFEAKGRKPPRNWKERYKETVTPDTSGLPELPEGWCWATVDQVSVQMRNGRSVRTRAGGFPVLRLSAITGAALDDCDIKPGDWGPEEAEPFRVRRGDFFVSRGNGSLDLVGRASFADDCVGEVAFPDTMIRVTFACRQLVRARFVAAIWNSQFVRRQITESAKTSAGIYKINQLDLRGVLVPVPTVAEQDRITGSHRDFESARSHLANRITVWRQHGSALRQSILKRAFEGRLVPQDSADEPASALLERIGAARKVARTSSIHHDQHQESPASPRTTDSPWGDHSP